MVSYMAKKRGHSAPETSVWSRKILMDSERKHELETLLHAQACVDLCAVWCCIMAWGVAGTSSEPVVMLTSVVAAVGNMGF